MKLACVCKLWVGSGLVKMIRDLLKNVASTTSTQPVISEPAWLTGSGLVKDTHKLDQLASLGLLHVACKFSLVDV
jgi:hypothetical protein